jgi:hypothetical protein
VLAAPRHHSRMDTPPPTPAQPSEPADPRLATWEALRDELQALHAKLEYAALMLRLQSRQD